MHAIAAAATLLDLSVQSIGKLTSKFIGDIPMTVVEMAETGEQIPLAYEDGLMVDHAL